MFNVVDRRHVVDIGPTSGGLQHNGIGHGMGVAEYCRTRRQPRTPVEKIFAKSENPEVALTRGRTANEHKV